MTGRSPTEVAELIARELGRPSTVELVCSGINEVFVVDVLVIRLAPPPPLGRPSSGHPEPEVEDNAQTEARYRSSASHHDAALTRR